MISPSSPGLLSAFLFIASFVGTLILTGLLLSLLRHHKIFDVPNARSGHVIAVPRGGGIGVLSILLLGLSAVNFRNDYTSEIWLIFIVALLLGLLSWLDDISKYGLDIRWRLGSHIVAASTALLLLPDEQLVFQGYLPFIIDRIVAAIALLWFMNLFNFMDGVDGISGVELGSIGAGFFLLSLFGAIPKEWELTGLVMIGVSIGFLYWNWDPAKIFLGDVGSIPIGFLVGFYLLKLTALGFMAPALLLSLYYTVDATWTLAQRVIRREKFWHAHREHGYQNAVDAGFSDANVVRKILGLNIVLIGLAIGAVAWPSAMLLFGLVLTLLFVYYLKQGCNFR